MSFRKEALKLSPLKAAFRGVSLAVGLLFACLPARAQQPPQDTLDLSTAQPIILRGDSAAGFQQGTEGLMLTEELNKQDPQKAAMLSAVLPGLGQLYVGQVWKVPVYYGTFMVLGHLMYTNNRLYNIFRQSLFAEVDGNPNTVNPFPRFAEASLRRNTDSFRRNRDYMVIIAGLVYMLNIADAHIAAHLNEFDINDELVINYAPAIGNINGMAYAGMGVKISF